MLEVMTREKEIRYSIRARAATDQFKHIQRLRGAAASLLDKLPDDLKNSPEAQLPCPAVDRKVYNIVHLIYRAKNYEGHSKDYEFSRLSMEEHWRAGYHDARRTLRHREVLERPKNLKASSPSISRKTAVSDSPIGRAMHSGGSRSTTKGAR